MKRTVKPICLVILIAAAVIFFGRFFLDMFDLIEYELPLSQDVSNILQVDLLDTSGEEISVLRSITAEEFDQFISDLMAVGVERHVNDPVIEHGDKTIRICYQDGGYDLLGDKVDFFDQSGEPLDEGGWFCINPDDLYSLFIKYS